jgi:2-haloacid dehalogenase
MQLETAPKWITFDCYGTLIDTRTGYVRYWKELLASKEVGARVDLMEFVESWGNEEFRLIQGRYQPYRTILTKSVETTLAHYGLPVREGDGEGLAEAWGQFLPFDDVNPILTQLQTRHKLALITNVDNDIVAHSIASMGIDFDGVFTAETCGAYKPSRIPFEYAVEQMGVPSAEVLHVAFGYKYDHTTAHELGFPTVWVNRRNLQLPAGIPIGCEMPDLLGLPAYLGMV